MAKKGKYQKQRTVQVPVEVPVEDYEQETKRGLEHSKKLTNDIRALLWVVTVGGILLAFYCVYTRFDGSLPWVAAMVGLPWTAHGVVCSFYLKMSQSDHRRGGITFEAAKANGFGAEVPFTDPQPSAFEDYTEHEDSIDSPGI